MVYFRYVKCDVKWTKLIDDACPTCASPCQVIENVPPMKWFREGEGAGPFACPSGSGTLSTRAEASQTTTDLVNLDPGDSFDGSRYDDDENDFQISQQDRFDWGEDMAVVQKLTGMIGSVSIADDNSDGGGTALWQLGKPNLYSRVLCASGVDGLPPRSSDSDIGSEDVDFKQKANILPVQEVDSTLSEHKVDNKDKPALLINDRSSNNAQISSKKKKKPRMSRNQRRNLGNKSSPAATKVVPQLELPDPIPSSGLSDGGSGWNDVVGKGNAKAAKKMQNDTLKRVNEREFINARSYLSRDSENETPIRERAAIDVRFGIGSAKHDVRRVVPRSALE